MKYTVRIMTFIVAIAGMSMVASMSSYAAKTYDVEVVTVIDSEGNTIESDQTEEVSDAEATEETDTDARQAAVNLAMSLVGGRYQYGGTTPSGFDCSGFTGYVLRNAAGVSVGRSSRDQACGGRSISAEEMQPGDLIFYSSGSSINHVAMYIGNGQIVHASTARTGVKIGTWNYRTPAKIVSYLG